MLKTTDNNCGNYQIESPHVQNLELIANKSIGSLIKEENENLLIFPNDLKRYGDDISKENIFTLDDTKLTTNNIMGFIGVNESELTIQSRFAQEDKEDYFLHYMLQKVFSINLFDLEHGTANESIFDFLLYLFPFYLKKALRQGLYKEYHKQNYNNANVRGTIDLNRHLKKNIPFIGNVAYRVREHSYDNKITQLIRHTIEFIRQHKFAQGILNVDFETQDCVTKIIQATPSYHYNQRISVVNKNLKPFSHPYFFEYKALQKICMQILRYEGLKYGKEKDKVYGLLFDGAWLWEEYLYTFLAKCSFKHPENNKSKGGIYLFDDSTYVRYPDFWKENFILDAKYKKLGETQWVNRDDMHQIITYMYTQKAGIGGFICPSSNDEVNPNKFPIGNLNGYGGEVNIWTLPIPRKVGSFTEFCTLMEGYEKKMVDLINTSFTFD